MRVRQFICLSSILALSVAAIGCDKKGDAPPKGGDEIEKVTNDEAPKADEGKKDDPKKVDGKDDGKKDDPKQDAPKKDAPADAPEPPAADAGPKGVKAPGNNPALLALVDAVKACDLKKSRPEWTCRKQLAPFVKAFDKTKDAATVANLLEDEDANVRFLAAHVWKNTMLMQRAEGRAYAARVVAAAEEETDKAVATLLGPILLQGPFKDAAFKAGVMALAETHALPELRAGIFSNLVGQSDEMVGFMKGRLAVEKDKTVRVAIVSGMYLARGASSAEACKIYESLLGDADMAVAGRAAYGLVWTNGACKAHYDAFLTHFDARAKDGKVDFSYLLNAKYMAQAKEATDAQKARFIAALKTVVTNDELSGMTRASALEVIGKTAGGKAYAKGFLNDADGSLKGAAKRIVDGK